MRENEIHICKGEEDKVVAMVVGGVETELTESENRKSDGRAAETQAGGEERRDKEMAKSGEKWEIPPQLWRAWVTLIRAIERKRERMVGVKRKKSMCIFVSISLLLFSGNHVPLLVSLPLLVKE